MKEEYQPYELDINTLGFYVDRLLYAMIKRQNRDLKAINSDLQHSEFIVLKVINALDGGVSQSQLASVMGKERSGISRTVASLEKKGYVVRSPRNGSTNYVCLTEKSKQFRPMLKQISDNLTNQAFKGFSQKKRESVLKSLEKLYCNSLLED